MNTSDLTRLVSTCAPVRTRTIGEYLQVHRRPGRLANTRTYRDAQLLQAVLNVVPTVEQQISTEPYEMLYACMWNRPHIIEGGTPTAATAAVTQPAIPLNALHCRRCGARGEGYTRGRLELCLNCLAQDDADDFGTDTDDDFGDDDDPDDD